MKTKRAVLVLLGMLVALAFSTQLARAGDVDCTTVVTSCGFGAPVGSAGPVVLTNGLADNATFTETVYNLGGIFTYVFGIHNLGPATLHLAQTWTAGAGDNFKSGLKFGVITKNSNVDDAGFSFNQFSLSVRIVTLNPLKNFTFYAQGPTFKPGFIEVSNTGSTGPGGSLDPVSEPTAPRLLGSSLLLMLGILAAGRLRLRSTV